MGKVLLIFLMAAGYINFANAEISKTCYPNVGCFVNGPPWSSSVRMIPPPQNPLEKKPFMYYYGRNLPNGKVIEVYPEADLKKVPYSQVKATYILIHGYTFNGKSPWLLRLKDVLLKKNDANVFILDYSKGSEGHFTNAVSNIRVFARIYALAFIKSNIRSSEMHFIGHSLGSHLGSYICKELKSIGHPVGWLTGLDVSAPFFEIFPNITRFDASDADFVDAHHTNAGVNGCLLPHGHTDVYYNRGNRQDRCDIYNEYEYFLDNIFNVGTSNCYHQMSHEYYINSIEYGCIYGLPSSMKTKLNLLQSTFMKRKLTNTLLHSCYPASCLQIGLGMKNSPLRGIYTVITNDFPPYCSKVSALLS